MPTYINEIRKVTDKPIKYLIYSHHHFDHIPGGQPFKDAGAKIIAHQKVKERLAVLKDPATPLPDETFADKKTIVLGGTTLELAYHGLNHSDSTIIMRLPKEKIVFTVDTVPVGSMPGRGMIDSYPLEWEDFLQKLYVMDWERLIPGHPGQPAGRLGTKKDVQIPPHPDAGRIVRGAGRRARRQVLGAGGKGTPVAEVRQLARLPGGPALRPPPLLRTLGPRYLSRAWSAKYNETRVRYEAL